MIKRRWRGMMVTMGLILIRLLDYKPCCLRVDRCRKAGRRVLWVPLLKDDLVLGWDKIYWEAIHRLGCTDLRPFYLRRLLVQLRWHWTELLLLWFHRKLQSAGQPEKKMLVDMRFWKSYKQVKKKREAGEREFVLFEQFKLLHLIEKTTRVNAKDTRKNQLESEQRNDI